MVAADPAEGRDGVFFQGHGAYAESSGVELKLGIVYPYRRIAKLLVRNAVENEYMDG